MGAEFTHHVHGLTNAGAHGGKGGKGLEATAYEAAYGQAHKGNACLFHEFLFRAIEAADEQYLRIRVLAA